MSATDMGLQQATGRGPVSFAFLQLRGPQLDQGVGNCNYLMGIGAAANTSSRADWALLKGTSADSLDGNWVPVFSLISWGMDTTSRGYSVAEQAPLKSPEPLQTLWVEPRHCVFPDGGDGHHHQELFYPR